MKRCHASRRATTRHSHIWRPHADFRKLERLVAEASDVYAIADKEFAALMDADEEEEKADDPAKHDAVIAALLDHPAHEEHNVADLRSMQRAAVAILRGLAAECVDLRVSFKANTGDRDWVVHFDNYTHSSGKQRAYITCPCKHDSSYFK